jgi:methyl-accepting chemotaxis protein
MKNFKRFRLPVISLENDADRQRRFLGLLSLIVLMVNLANIILLLTPILLQGRTSFISALVIFFSLGVPIFSFWCSRQKNIRLVNIASWLVIVYFCLTVMYMTVATQGVLPLPVFFIMVIMMSIFLLPPFATPLFALVGIGTTVATYLLEIFDTMPRMAISPDRNAYINIVLWTIGLLAPMVAGLVLAQQLRNATRQANEQTAKLNRLLVDLAEKYELGQEVSEQITAVTGDLNTSATAQAQGSRQQVTALESVTVVLRDLNQTARQIAASSQAIDLSSQSVRDVAHEVELASQEISKRGERGLSAVRQAVASQQEVTQLYNRLVETLADLQKRSDAIQNVVALMQNIASETHLLALNAAIEAAGAGERGARFGVVAGEVKSLADRSLHAGREIAASLGDIETCIGKAFEIAEKGQRETKLALAVGQQSGEVMTELANAIRQTSTEIQKIRHAAVQMHGLTHAITVATQEQSSASGQAVEALQEVGNVAVETVTGSEQLKITIADLEKLSNELTAALTLNATPENSPALTIK